MKLALSTNWNSRRLKNKGGEAIVDEALELGFDALELGFALQQEQVPGIKKRLDEMPVESVHAFSPVPLSAPYGHPELHVLASHSADERALARALLLKCIRFAGSMGARRVVLHAGRIGFGTFFRRRSSDSFRAFVKEGKLDLKDAKYVKLLEKSCALRKARGEKVMPLFRAELDSISPELEKNGVELALENLPYYEAFPDEDQMEAIAKDYPRVRAWFDTGHARVRASFGWSPSEAEVAKRQLPYLAGCHLNDVKDFTDDHFAVGCGKVDFAALSALADDKFSHVAEPGSSVTKDALAAGVKRIRELWK